MECFYFMRLTCLFCRHTNLVLFGLFVYYPIGLLSYGCVILLCSCILSYESIAITMFQYIILFFISL